jgi:hypothetical protein
MLVAWIILSIVVGLIGNGRTIGFMGGFFVSIFFSPLIGLIVTLISGKKKIVNPEIEKLKAEIEVLKQK